MVDRVSKAISARGVTKEDIVERVNREVIPPLIELRTRFNELLHPPSTTPPAADAYVVTNPVTRRTFDTATVTLPELAEVVGTIIADLQTLRLLK